MKRQIWKIDFDHNEPEEARKSGGARGCSIRHSHLKEEAEGRRCSYPEQGGGDDRL